MFILVAALLYILLARAVLAADYSGPVVSVPDGDTIEVLHNTHPERIRLSGIDAQKSGSVQPFPSRPALRFPLSLPRMGLPCEAPMPPNIHNPSTLATAIPWSTEPPTQPGTYWFRREPS